MSKNVVMVNVESLGFPDLRPVNLSKEIVTDRCYDVAHDPVDDRYLICTRAKDHSRRHYTSGSEGIVSRVWSSK